MFEEAAIKKISVTKYSHTILSNSEYPKRNREGKHRRK